MKIILVLTLISALGYCKKQGKGEISPVIGAIEKAMQLAEQHPELVASYVKGMQKQPKKAKKRKNRKKNEKKASDHW